jgi:excisionase family DNA binding protein
MDDVTTIKPTAVYELYNVAAGLDISIRTLERVIKAGELKAVRVGRHRFVTGKALIAWLEGRADGKGKPKREPEAAPPA